VNNAPTAAARLRRWAAALALSGLGAGVAQASGWRPIAQIPCDAGGFEIAGRPFARNEGGGSQLELRYRFRGRVLDAISFEDHYHNLSAYLPADTASTIEFGLRLNTSGLSRPGGSFQRGDTLYLDPARFDSTEFRPLGQCLLDHHRDLAHAIHSTTLRSRGGLLGLGTYHTTTGRDGIARLVHAPSPLAGLYRHTGLLIVEQSGRVLLRTDLTANNPAEEVMIGTVAHGRGKPVLRLREGTIFRGEPFQPEWLRAWRDRRGHRVADDFRIEME